MTSELSPQKAYEELIGKTVRIENADPNLLNVVDVATGKRYWIESSGHLYVYTKEE